MKKTPKSPARPQSQVPEDALAFPRERIPSIRRVMMPRDTNAFGTIFGGVILAEIDLAAAVEGHRHHSGRLVTVALDSVVFRAPVHVGDLVSFFTETVRIGRTSIRVKICVWAERRFSGDGASFVTEAEATMVAVDAKGQPVPVERPKLK
jgi:acyl-CoA thioesterase YciA